MFLIDGFSTTITFSLTAAVVLREREVQPPSLDMGGGIDTSTMRNLTYRTKGAKALCEWGDLTIQAQWDPDNYNSVNAMMGISQIITITFPDGSTLAFWGFIDKFTPASMRDGEFPLAEVKIVPTVTSNAVGAALPPHTNPVRTIRAAGNLQVR